MLYNKSKSYKITMDKNTITPNKRFWQLIKQDRKEIRNIYIYSIFSGLISLALPLGIQTIINLIQGGQISTSWVVLISIVILSVILTGVIQVSQLKITEHLQQKIFTRAAFEFGYRIVKIKIETFSKHYAPELMNRFFDIISIQKSLTKVLIDFSTASILTIFGLIVLSLYHTFFIAFSIILVVLVYFIFKLTYKKGLETSLKESKHKYAVAHWLQELARTNISFKLAGKTTLPLKRIDSLTNQYIESRESHFKILIYQYYLLVGFRVLIAGGLLIAGSLLVINQQMNLGQFVASEIIILMILGSVEKLILSLETIYDLLTSLEKVGQVTDIELEETNKLSINDFLNDEKGLSVELNNVSFSYPFQKRLILDSLNLKIEAGESVMITGDIDSGKTTLLYILSGLYKITEGNVLYNKIALNNLNLDELRSVIGDCLMDELLYEGTLLDNITMGRKKATLENVQWAVKHMGLEDFIKSLPNGYETKILPQGRQFSKGVLDKIILARSIVDKPKILLIKDAFYSFDKDEGERIMNFLTDKSNNWTFVAVSKDDRLKNKVDKVLYMKSGKITQIKTN